MIREWTESLWGKNSPYVKVRQPSAVVIRGVRALARMPTAAEKALLHQRDGHHCRFCGIPVIRAEVRKRMKAAYPQALSWATRNTECHAAFQAMWAQYDHVVPFNRGGLNDLENLVITCAPCNFGRMQYTLDEVGLLDPEGARQSDPRGRSRTLFGTCDLAATVVAWRSVTSRGNCPVDVRGELQPRGFEHAGAIRSINSGQSCYDALKIQACGDTSCSPSS